MAGMTPGRYPLEVIAPGRVAVTIGDDVVVVGVDELDAFVDSLGGQ